MTAIMLSSDEIEVACDALWFLKQREGLSEAGSQLWDRLQPIRRGDYGQQGPTVALSAEEADIIKAALDAVDTSGGIDPDERALAHRLSRP